MTLRKKDLEAEVRAEPRILPHKDSGPEAISERPQSGPITAPKRPRKSDFNLRLDQADYQALQRESETRGISMSAIVRELVRKYLKGAR
jgi:hypothetical protein